MRYLSKLATHILEVKKCQSFANDPSFNHIRKSLELFGKCRQSIGTPLMLGFFKCLILGVKWEKALLNERNTVTLMLSRMDRAFFHPDRFEVCIK